MKNKKLVLKMLLAILLSAALIIAACQDGNGPDNTVQEQYGELFDTANGFPDALSNSWKIWGHRNALITQGFGADPTVLVYNGRAYVYSSNDALMYENGTAIQMTYAGGIQGLRAISSADLANWTDHGIINVGNDPVSTNPIDPYDASNRVTPYDTKAWAPSAVWKRIDGVDKFFIYFANSGNGIGVITADSPTGPWTSPLNKLLIDRSTPTCADIQYLFDPGVMVDDDGIGYMVFGGGNDTSKGPNGRRVKLGADMISLDGDPLVWDVPNLFEDNEIVKINGKYYYSYCQNGGVIAYMTCDTPLGTYSAPTEIMNPPQNQLYTPDQNNHHCIFQFKGENYIAYHASIVAPAMMSSLNRYRSPLINKININGNGTISRINMTRLGVPQKGNLNPYVLNEAETIGIMGGIYTRAVSGAGNGMVVTSIDTGDWVALYNVDFGSNGAKKFKAKVLMPSTPADYVGAIEVRLDPKGDGESSATAQLSPTKTARIKEGEVIGRVKFEGATGQYATAEIQLYRTVTGVHDLAFVFYSSLGVNPETVNPDSRHKKGFEFDQWQFME